MDSAERKVVLASAGTYLLIRLLDIGSTVAALKQSGGNFYESNVWARNADGSLNVAHALGITGLWFVALGGFGALMWLALRRLDRKVAVIAAVTPAWWFSLDTLQVVVHNLLTAAGWYQPLE